MDFDSADHLLSGAEDPLSPPHRGLTHLLSGSSKKNSNALFSLYFLRVAPPRILRKPAIYDCNDKDYIAQSAKKGTRSSVNHLVVDPLLEPLSEAADRRRLVGSKERTPFPL